MTAQHKRHKPQFKSISGWRPSPLSSPDNPDRRAHRTRCYHAWLAARVGEDEAVRRIEDQHELLARRANAAVQRLADALVWRGWAACVRPGQYYTNVETMEECIICDGSGRVQGETCCLCNGMGAELRYRAITVPCMCRNHGYYTDGTRLAYVGTKRARGYLPKRHKPLQIILAPGRDPDPAECEAILDDALSVQPELVT